MEEPVDVPREHRVRQLVGRLRRSAALLLASHRRDEVVETVARAETDEEATDAVSELLDVDRETASEVVEMPVSSFTRERTRAREEETARLEERLASLREEDPEGRTA
jgi:DNA gyrase/topoisomerase IV subunit A